MLTAKLISTEDELIQVAELSRANLVSNIPEMKGNGMSWYGIGQIIK